MTAVDRRADGYEPDFDIDYEFGKQGELFVTDVLDAIKSNRVETKNDDIYQYTGNIYVEYECFRRGKWQPSGIAITKSEFWAFVLHNNVSVVFVRTDVLKEAARQMWRDPANRKDCPKGTHPTRGVRVEVSWLLQSGTRMAGVA